MTVVTQRSRGSSPSIKSKKLTVSDIVAIRYSGIVCSKLHESAVLGPELDVCAVLYPFFFIYSYLFFICNFKTYLRIIFKIITLFYSG